MKALTRTLRLWPSLLFGLAACASGGDDNGSGSGNASSEPTRELSEPIIGGHLDTTTNGVVALAFKGHGQVSVFCSGSLLAPNLVLTARHCIARIDDGSSEEVKCDSSEFTAVYDPRQIFVSTDSEPESNQGQLYPVQEIREAPGSSNVCGFDVALLILSNGGVSASAATPIEPVLDDPTLANARFSAVGYGLQDPDDAKGTTAGTRQRFDTSSVYCVGDSCPVAAAAEADEFVGNSPVCSGDSGGPALDTEGRVFGVTSRGDSACTYALYSNVASWADFVRNTALDAAAAAGYNPPSWATAGTVKLPGADDGGAANAAGASAAGAANPAGGGAVASGGAVAAGGAPSDLAPPGKPSATTVDPLGETCTVRSDCPGTYQCYSSDSKPPGKCVPICSAENPTCPKDYACSVDSKVCTPTSVTKHLSASCSLGKQPGPDADHNAAFAVLLGAGLTWLGRRGRHLR